MEQRRKYEKSGKEKLSIRKLPKAEKKRQLSHLLTNKALIPNFSIKIEDIGLTYKPMQGLGIKNKKEKDFWALLN